MKGDGLRRKLLFLAAFGQLMAEEPAADLHDLVQRALRRSEEMSYAPEPELAVADDDY